MKDAKIPIRRPRLTRAQWEFLLGQYRMNATTAQIRERFRDQFGRSISAKTLTTAYRRGYHTPDWAKIPIADQIADEQRIARGLEREREKAEGIPGLRKVGNLDAAEQLRVESQGVRGAFAAAITMLGNLSNLSKGSMAVSKAIGERIVADVQANRITTPEALELLRKMSLATKQSVEAFHTSMKTLRLHLGAPEMILGLIPGTVTEFNGADALERLGEKVLKKAIADMLEGRTSDEVIAFMEWQDGVERDTVDVEGRLVQ